MMQKIKQISEKSERNTKFNQKENPHNSLSYADLSIPFGSYLYLLNLLEVSILDVVFAI